MPTKGIQSAAITIDRRNAGGRLARVRKVSDQFEAMMVPIPAPVSAEAADGSHGVAIVEVRG